MSTDEYVPSEFDVCNVYVDYYMQHSGKTHSEANAEFVRFIERYTARVCRDAAREALDGLAEHIDWTASQFLGVRVGSQKAQDVRDYRDTHYPETED